MSLEGERLGSYRLLCLLGSGGMGEVYLAEDARIGQQVAIKVIRSEGTPYPESTTAKEAARLFEREAKAIARLDHPYILPLYAYGEEMLHEQLLTYLVMPYRKDGTLASWLRRRGNAEPLSPTQVTPLLQQAAQALHHAHQQQVIHQDVKPTNFLVRLRDDQPDRPDLLLADFGIAKLTNATASASQSVRGTPTYMAPEQWEGYPVPATDQYALAIMVYELLAGHPPFQGGPGQVMRQHYQTPPQSLSTLNPHLSPTIDAVLLRALAKQPEERFASVTAFAQAFQEAAQSDGELQVILAISPTEAETGTTRSLMLPGGRQVSVSVPAGVHDGSVLRLEGQDLSASQRGPVGPLVLTMRIAVESPPRLLQAPVEPTSPVSRERGVAPTILAAQASKPPTEMVTLARQTPPPTQVSRLSTPLPVAVRPEVMFPTKPAKGNATRRIMLLGLASLVVAALASGIVWFTLHHTVLAGTITEFPVPTSHSLPLEITTGPDGDLWFTDYTMEPSKVAGNEPEISGSKIGRISTNGTITEFPLSTANSAPLGITAGPEGNLWFTEQNGNKIGCITPNGTITEYPIPTSNSFPYGITAGSDGNLWFTEQGGNKIGRISTNGTITEFPITDNYNSFDSPNHIAAGPDGNLWFTGQGFKIERISTNGTISGFPIPTSPAWPFAITAGPDGNLWFTDTGDNKIGRISMSGTTVEFPIPTSGGMSGEITAGPDGNLWFTDSNGNKIGRISTNGTIIEFPLPTPQRAPFGITAGPDGNLWFTEQDKIGRITSGK